jgi:hypothetical protein
MEKEVLEQLLSRYNWWMGVATIAVAVGILGEYAAHFAFEKEARSHKREMAVSILFGVLVLGGVVGEYLFGTKLSQVSEQLQQLADVEVAHANKDAAEARKTSSEAQDRAAPAELKTEEERLARLRLEEEIAPRRIAAKQRIFLVSCIGSHRGERMYLVGRGDKTQR